MIPIQIGMNGPVVSAELLIFPFPLLPKKMLCVMLMTGIDSFTLNTNRPIWKYNLRIYLKDIRNKIFSYMSSRMESISFLTMRWVPVFQADCIVSMKMHSVKDQGSTDSNHSKLTNFNWDLRTLVRTLGKHLRCNKYGRIFRCGYPMLLQ